MKEDDDIPFVRGELINNLNDIEYHKRTLGMIKMVDEQIKTLSDEVDIFDSRQFNNPREETGYLHNVKTLSVLKRQKKHLMRKLNDLELRIQENVEISKELTPLKPLEKKI